MDSPIGSLEKWERVEILTDFELGRPLAPNILRQIRRNVDIHHYDPEVLCPNRDDIPYFISPMYGTADRPTPGGLWKQDMDFYAGDGDKTAIIKQVGDRIISGFQRYFKFFEIINGAEYRTAWSMFEYSLNPATANVLCSIFFEDSDAEDSDEDDDEDGSD